MSVLSESEKILIYELVHRHGRTQMDVARFMNVSQATVSKIVNDPSKNPYNNMGKSLFVPSTEEE